MISLGKFDQGIPASTLADYKALVKKVTVVQGGRWDNHLRDEGRWVEFNALDAGDPMKVSEVQQFLKDAGFLPFGKIDGICGYRTSSAIRLFQEYLRTVDGMAEIGYPDGLFGKNSAAQARTWLETDRKADWAEFSASNPSKEYSELLESLKMFKDQVGSEPGTLYSKISSYPKPSDTVKPDEWNFDPQKIHLIGIRRRKALQDTQSSAVQVLNDLFVLLINGVVFKFYGSTEPGTKVSPKGYPFLVPGQHLYRFGWHKISDTKKVYHALKPGTDKGVLIVRSKNLIPTDADLSGPLEINNTINIHWGGEGVSDKAGWSAGCQVIAGRSYINHHDEAINCTKFAAANYDQLGTKAGGVYQTKGAYSVLEDVVAALSGASQDDNIVRYTLIREEELNKSRDIVSGLVERLKTC